jgi:hypothetical protein
MLHVVGEPPPPAQQAPVEGAHGFGEHVVEAPCHVPPPVVQADCVCTLHDAPAQQAPVAGCGHGLGEHVVPFPSHDPPIAEQIDDVSSEHEPLATQHAPSDGCGHGFGEHVPLAFGVPPALVQSSAVSTWHTPVGKQHAASPSGHGSAPARSSVSDHDVSVPVEPELASTTLSVH